MANAYVILTCGLRRGAGHGAGNGAGNDVVEETDDEWEMFVYEFIGDLDKYDQPDLLSEDRHVVQEGYKATALLTRALGEMKGSVRGSVQGRCDYTTSLDILVDP
jgi:hypothetical protein